MLPFGNAVSDFWLSAKEFHSLLFWTILFVHELIATRSLTVFASNVSKRFGKRRTIGQFLKELEKQLFDCILIGLVVHFGDWKIIFCQPAEGSKFEH